MNTIFLLKIKFNTQEKKKKDKKKMMEKHNKILLEERVENQLI